MSTEQRPLNPYHWDSDDPTEQDRWATMRGHVRKGLHGHEAQAIEAAFISAELRDMAKMADLRAKLREMESRTESAERDRDRWEERCNEARKALQDSHRAHGVDLDPEFQTLPSGSMVREVEVLTIPPAPPHMTDQEVERRLDALPPPVGLGGIVKGLAQTVAKDTERMVALDEAIERELTITPGDAVYEGEDVREMLTRLQATLRKPTKGGPPPVVGQRGAASEALRRLREHFREEPRKLLVIDRALELAEVLSRHDAAKGWPTDG